MGARYGFRNEVRTDLVSANYACKLLGGISYVKFKQYCEVGLHGVVLRSVPPQDKASRKRETTALWVEAFQAEVKRAEQRLAAAAQTFESASAEG